LHNNKGPPLFYFTAKLVCVKNKNKKKLTTLKNIYGYRTAHILKKEMGICYTKKRKKRKKNKNYIRSLYFWGDFVAMPRLAAQHFARGRRRTALEWVDNLNYLVAGYSPGREEPTKCLAAAQIVTTSLTDEKVAAVLIPTKVVGLPSAAVAASVDESRELAVGEEVGAEGLVAATPVYHRRHHYHSTAEQQPQNLYCPASFLLKVMAHHQF